jgi:hypothetical protein
MATMTILSFFKLLYEMIRKIYLICVLIVLPYQFSFSQNEYKQSDTLSKIDKFNKKAEALFKIIPVPVIGYTQEAGTIVGLAKFNAFELSKKDTISQPSKISETVTYSTKDRFNLYIGSDLIFNENKYIILSKFNYSKRSEYLLGIGNDVSLNNIEEIKTEFLGFSISGLKRVYSKIYAGIKIDMIDYFDVETSPDSFLIKDMVPGLYGGTNFGLGVLALWDNRDNRYNAHSGAFFKLSFIFYNKSLGSAYQFNRFEFDARKYFIPWLNHVIAIQTTLTQAKGDVPYYNLAQLGGANKMRGYYQGALRDNILIDGQIEYRLPIWKMLGFVSWVGTGRVVDSYQALEFKDFWISYGGGLRIKVDSENDINLRFDVGFGNGSINAVYFGFSEAF